MPTYIDGERSDGFVQRLKVKTAADGPLRNLTFAVKDNMAVNGLIAGFGSPSWAASRQPAPAHADCVQKVLDAAAELVGTTICDELTLSMDGVNSFYGTPRNPRYPERIPGGSSSGSASVVASGFADFALGTDTAGSVRVPAAYCGIYGLRSSHGLISKDGILPLGETFDAVGVFARQALVLTRVLSVLLGESSDCEVDEVSDKAFGKSFGNELTVLVDASARRVLDRANQERFDHSLAAVFDGLKSVEPPYDLEEMVDLFAVMRGYEAWRHYGQWYSENKPALSPAIAERLLAGASVTETQYREGQARREAIISETVAWLQAEGMQETPSKGLPCITVLVLPVVCDLPPLLSASDSELGDNRRKNLLLNAPGSFLGFPELVLGHLDFPIGLLALPGCDLALCRLVESIGLSW